MSLKEYHHLKQNEKTIAERWVKLVPIQGQREWDVHLDVPLPELPAWWSNRDVKLFTALRSKRIDLVVHASDAEWIIEITPMLSKAPLGGVILYEDLYMKQYKPTLPIKLGIIVEVDDLAEHPVLEKLGIKWWVV